MAGPASGVATAVAGPASAGERDGHAVRRRHSGMKWARRTPVTVSQVARRGGAMIGSVQDAAPVPFTSMVRGFASARFGNVMLSTPFS